MSVKQNKSRVIDISENYGYYPSVCYEFSSDMGAVPFAPVFSLGSLK